MKIQINSYKKITINDIIDPKTTKKLKKYNNQKINKYNKYNINNIVEYSENQEKYNKIFNKPSFKLCLIKKFESYINNINKLIHEFKHNRNIFNKYKNNKNEIPNITSFISYNDFINYNINLKQKIINLKQEIIEIYTKYYKFNEIYNIYNINKENFQKI